MRVICAGMRRSGSTWLYNVARLAVATRGEVYGAFEDDYRITPHRLQVIKAHRFAPELLFGADAVLVSFRDLRDVAASAVRRKLVAENPVDVVGYLTKALRDEYAAWRPYATLAIRYESMVANRLDAVNSILAALKVKADARAVAAAVEALPLPDKPDAETLLHPGHITDGRPGSYRETLSNRTVHAIEAVFGDWLEANGYGGAA